MKTAIFSIRRDDKTVLPGANAEAGRALRLLKDRPTTATAPPAAVCKAVGVFVDDCADAERSAILAAQGARLVATRSSGDNQIDTAARLGIAAVPAAMPAP